MRYRTFGVALMSIAAAVAPYAQSREYTRQAHNQDSLVLALRSAKRCRATVRQIGSRSANSVKRRDPIVRKARTTRPGPRSTSETPRPRSRAAPNDACGRSGGCCAATGAVGARRRPRIAAAEC